MANINEILYRDYRTTTHPPRRIVKTIDNSKNNLLQHNCDNCLRLNKKLNKVDRGFRNVLASSKLNIVTFHVFMKSKRLKGKEEIDKKNFIIKSIYVSSQFFILNSLIHLRIK